MFFCFCFLLKISPKTALLFPKSFIFINGPHIYGETDRDREKERERKKETEKGD